MRLFDKVYSSCADIFRRNAFRQAVSLGNTTVLLADTVAREYAALESDVDSPDRYPYARPPWTSTFVEWFVPEYWWFPKDVLDDRGFYERVAPHKFRIKDSKYIAMHGAWVTCHERGHDTFKEIAKLDIDSSDADLFLCMNFFAEAQGVTNALPLVGIAKLDKTGLCLGKYGVLGEKLESLSNEAQMDIMTMFMNIPMRAFTYLNCKNVTTADISDEVAPAPKIQRRLNIPAVKRYTLVVGGYVHKPRSRSDTDAKDIMPFHMCRGHFATYTEQAPLFGKYVGRFWIPPHAKGKRERGEIIKDYAIEEAASIQ